MCGSSALCALLGFCVLKCPLTHEENFPGLINCITSQLRQAEEALYGFWLRVTAQIVSSVQRPCVSEAAENHSDLTWMNISVNRSVPQRWRGEIPVHTLSHSEGRGHRQGDDQESISSQYRSVSPALLVLHARLWQDGNTEGDLIPAASP